MKIVKDIQKQQSTSKISDKEAEEAIKTILEWMGEDPNREGLLETPKRVIKAFEEYFTGYHKDPKKILEKTFSETSNYQDFVMLKNISFRSHCEHHLAPIIGSISIAYIPNNSVVGISKLARIVDVFAKRLQTQETMTAQIGNSIQQYLNPKGVAVYVSAEHHCMSSRGVNKLHVDMVTTHFLGEFKEKIEFQERFLSSI